MKLSITNCFEKQRKLQEKEHHTEQSEIDHLESSDNFDLDSNTPVDLAYLLYFTYFTFIHTSNVYNLYLQLCISRRFFTRQF